MTFDRTRSRLSQIVRAQAVKVPTIITAHMILYPFLHLLIYFVIANVAVDTRVFAKSHQSGYKHKKLPP